MPKNSVGDIASPPRSSESTVRLLTIAVAAIAGFVGLGIRSQLARTPLWLDEAQSVAIVDSGIVTGLGQDGHPPLYYWILQLWSDTVGSSDGDLRALSALFGFAAVLALGFVGQRIGGERVMLATVALASVSPFLVRYGTEVRMYSLVTLLSALWWLAVQSVRAAHSLDRDSLGREIRPRLVLVAVLVGMLCLTHYWAMFLFAAWVLAALWRRQFGAGSVDRQLLLAHAVGGLAFLPWVPTFLDQLAHTGTPWAGAPNPLAMATSVLTDIGGPSLPTGSIPAATIAAAVAVALFAIVGFGGRTQGPSGLTLSLTGLTETRSIAWLTVGPIVLAAIAITATDSAFAGRYLAVIVGFVLVLVARGITQFPGLSAPVALVLVCGLFAIGAQNAATDVRSQGQQVAQAIAADAGGADSGIVVVCPDQLGPAVSRYLAAEQPGLSAVSYPLLADAARVDWTDYADRHARANPAAIADQLVADAAGNPIWMVWQEGYLTLEGQCSALYNALTERIAPAVPASLVVGDPLVFEPMRLDRFSRAE